MKIPFPEPVREAQSLPAFRITSIRERGGRTRIASYPILIPLPAQLEGMTDDCFYPEMVQVKYRGEWYLMRRKLFDACSILHPASKEGARRPGGLSRSSASG